MSNTIYARQVNPEFQSSPFDDYFDDENECAYELFNYVILDGNRNYRSYTNPIYDHLMEHGDSMSYDWYMDGHNFCYIDGKCVATKCKRTRPIAEYLSDYGFERQDGKPWTNKQKHIWSKLMDEYSVTDDEFITMALQLITGHKWVSTTIYGCCQGDWQDVYYDADAYSEEMLKQLEIEYFNMGTEWMVHDGTNVPNCADDVDGWCMYCHGSDIDEVANEIRLAVDAPDANVIMWAYDGYERKHKYTKEVISNE